jgi:antitoxin component YwqK of YwqJK toxin-antitoxin module
MKPAGSSYSNGQKITNQNGEILTYYFEDGTIKAQGTSVNGVMQGKWIFNKKEGYLWQTGHFNDKGQKHGAWVRYNPDGSVQSEAYFEDGQQIKK